MFRSFIIPLVVSFSGCVLPCLVVKTSATTTTFPYTLAWKRLTNTAVKALAWHDSLIFIGGDDGVLAAVRQRDGASVWQERGQGPLRTRLGVHGSKIICADTWGRIMARSGDSGRLIWQVQRLGWGDAQVQAMNDRVFVGSADGWLYALNATNGDELWRVRTGWRTAHGFWLEKDKLWVCTSNGDLLEIDIRDGRYRRQIDIEALVPNGPVIAGSWLVLSTKDGYVRAYNKKHLELQWERRLGAVVRGLPQIVGDKVIGAATNGWVYGLDKKDGSIAWKYDLGSEPSGTPFINHYKEMIVATVDGRLVALASELGLLHWEQMVVPGQALYPFGTQDAVYISAEDGFLYAFQRIPIIKHEVEALWDDWWESNDGASKNGYIRQHALRRIFQGREAIYIHDESVNWRNGFLRIENEFWVDENLRPLAFTRRRTEASQVVETKGVWQGDTVQIETRLGEQVREHEVKLGTGTIFPEVALRWLARQGRLQAGIRDSLDVFDYNTFKNRHLYVNIKKSEVAIGEWKDETLLQVDMRYQGVDYEGIVFSEWLDKQGRSVRAQVPALGANQIRVEAAQALSWEPPGVDKTVQLDYALEDPASIERLVLALPLNIEEAQRFLVEDKRQQLLADSTGTCRLLVKHQVYNGAGAARLPVTAAPLGPFLQSSLYVQSDHPRIQALAQRLVGDERNTWKVVQRLAQWVYDHMIPRDTNVRFKSSLEVLQDMEGTCSEYAVLFMALCRAAGVPVRACVGFMAAPETSLTLHIWTQVYVGQWVDIDPSWEGLVVDASHIKTGQACLTPAGIQSLNLPLQRFLVQMDTLKVIEYESGNRLFLGTAAALFTEAEEAERHFAEERAQELYHQIILLPWNHCSSEAYVRIGRFNVQRQEWATAEWALQQLLRLDDGGDATDQALFYLARSAEGQGRLQEAIVHLETLVEQYPGHDLADDALGRLGELSEQAEGCKRARRYYLRLREEYRASGWGRVAESALERCARREAILQE